MEYATLARAFVMAGAPTVVATLWKANDEAGRQLMEGFYRNMAAGDDRFVALSKAQRAMLAGPERFRSPMMWAAYIPFGRP
jgi:CHAT domain-containing protein